MIETAKRAIWAAVGFLTVVSTIAWAVWGNLRDWRPAVVAVGGLLLAGAAAVLARRRRRRAHRQRQRDGHLARTAHELRGPLAAVINALEIVRTGMARTPEEAAEFLDEADLAARHLAFLVNDVLDEAAIEAGKLRVHVQPQRVDDIIGEALRVLAMQSARSDVAIVAAEPRPRACLQVHADERRLLQVLFNLAGNALKFSPPGGVVQLRVDALPERIRFRVLDDGRGVAPQLRSHLFEPFAVDEHQEHAEGTGLGLHISHRLVEQMHGRIGYRPRTPTGSEFWFELPRASDAGVAAPAALAQ